MRWSSSLVLFLAAACGGPHSSEPFDTEDLVVDPGDIEEAPPASPRLDDKVPADMSSRIDSYFEGRGSQRIHAQLDRPMYKPGETVWVKTWSVATRGLARNPRNRITYDLVNPRGQVVETKLVAQQNGTASNDFILGNDAPGGQWTLRATLPTGEIDERPFIVSSYTAPRINKKLEFVREAYGAGDRVDALLELEQSAGGPMANHEVRALLQVAGETLLEKTLTTDETGAVLVSAKLPTNLTSSDGLLTLLVEDGGVTESISRSVPIVLADLQLAFFPEGGDLIEGLPGRVYFESTNRHGEPADVKGFIKDDRGDRVGSFTSVHDGLGRVALTPKPGRTYTAHVTSPVGLKDGFALPEAKKEGCALRSFDDLTSHEADVRVAVRCSHTREVLIAGVLRENTIDTAAVEAGPDKDAVVYLHPSKDFADKQGAVRVTIFDQDLNPMAERLVYRNHGRDLNISVTPDRERYGPRDEVVLAVETTDPSGRPIEAELALSVVNDAVIGLADDKEGHMLTRLYLEPELVDSPKDPGWYYDRDEKLAARGMDLVMGTKGYRRFEWKSLWNPEPIAAIADTGMWLESEEAMDDGAVVVAKKGGRLRMPRIALAKPKPRAMAMAPAPMAPPDMPQPDMAPPMVEVMEPMAIAAEPVEVHKRERRDERKAQAKHMPAKEMMAEDMLGGMGYLGGDFADHDMAGRGMAHQGWAAVRVFPKPDYSAGFSGTRTDFRDTVHWEPTVQTGADGKGEVRFYLSDSVATFRVTTEGLGTNYAGHDETTLVSVLPVSVATKLPAAVSAGDKLVLPITVSNTRDKSLDVGVSSHIDSEIVSMGKSSGMLTVAAGASDTHWIPVEIGQGNEMVSVRLEAEGGGLYDSVERQLRVVPAGFPRSWSAAGESQGSTKLTFQLDEFVPKSLTASVVWHPGSVSTLISGMEGLIREPGGCFEQTSSTNWPNVAILSYLEAHDGDPRLIVKSSKALDSGYAKLTGYQVSEGGFETWGSGPGKEALSAFGLLQFADMAKVYPVTDDILSKDAKYLRKQRNGKGGFKNTGESAHGYGSAPAPVLDGFITYALVTTGNADGLDKELEHQANAARTSKDPYVLALATRSLLLTEHPEGKKAVDRLAALQAEDGSFPGAESSITRSYEANLLVESTALAALALMEAGNQRSKADKAASWLIENRQGPGTWGATQATALALDALTTHAEVNKVPRSGGELFVEVNGEPMGTLIYTAEQTEPLQIDGWEAALHEGSNDIVLRHKGGEPLPFTVEVAWTSIEPTSAPGAELSLETSLNAKTAGMGDTVRLTATIENQTNRIVPSPIARIGLPAGLEAQTWQLKQLQDRGEIAFFETRLREVTLYWDGIHKGGEHTVNLDLTAMVPGTFTGPASSAYPYYNDDEKAWDGGLVVTIEQP